MIKTIVAPIVAALALGVPMSAFAAGPEVFVAHRGLGGDAQIKYRTPEQSLASADWALKTAAAHNMSNLIVDGDVSWTSDGKLVMVHDDTWDRTANSPRNTYVHRTTLAKAKTFKLEIPGLDEDGNGNDDNTVHSPPSLNQWLDFLRYKKTPDGQLVKITIEMKGAYWTKARTQRLEDVLRSKGMFNSRVNVHSFNQTYVGWARQLGFPNIGYVAPSAGPLPSATTMAAMADSIFVKHTLITQAKLDEYNAKDIKVYVWTADEPAEYNKVLALSGVYAMVSDDLKEALEYVEQAA